MIKSVKINELFNRISFFFLCLFPVSFLYTGFLNALLVVFTLLSIIFIILTRSTEIFENKYFVVLGLFFLYLIFQSFLIEYNQSIIKSFFYLKFFFLFLFCSFIVKFQKINIFLVSKINLLFCVILSFDIFFQFFLGTDIFGLSGEMGGQLKDGLSLESTRFAGFFGNELVAGTFLSTLGFVYLSIFFYHKDYSKLNILLFFVIFSLMCVAVLMTGDRSPLISLIFIVLFNIAFNKGARLYFLIYSFILIILFILFISFNPASKHRYVLEMKRYLNFDNIGFNTSISITNSAIIDYKYLVELIKKDPHPLYDGINEVKLHIDKVVNLKEENNIEDEQYVEFLNYKNLLNNNDINVLISLLKDKIREYEKDLKVFLKFQDKFDNIEKEKNFIIKYYKYYKNSPWGQHHSAALDIFRDHKLFGTGIRSYRYICHSYDDDQLYLSHTRCSSHPHNIHFELLSETGLIGYIIFLFLTISIFLKIFFKNNDKTFFKNFSFVFILSILMAFIIPFKPTGALFSSWFGSSFWFVFSSTYYLYLKK